jgi:nucleotide-binding universal stress UspA family protein
MANIVIVGVDGSDSSRLAAVRAAEVAAMMGATLHVLTAVDKVAVHEDPAGPGTAPLTSGEEAEAIAAQVADGLREIVGDITSGPLAGKPAAALVEEAERLEARLIVVGNKRVQGVARILGNVASSVAAHAPCDVYIVKST